MPAKATQKKEPEFKEIFKKMFDVSNFLTIARAYGEIPEKAIGMIGYSIEANEAAIKKLMALEETLEKRNTRQKLEAELMAEFQELTPDQKATILKMGKNLRTPVQ